MYKGGFQGGLTMKKKRLLLGCVIVAAVAFVVVEGGSPPTKYMTVSEVRGNAENLYGKKLQVSGRVTEWDKESNSIIVSYGGDNILVRMEGAPPGALTEGKDIVATGILDRGNGTHRLVSASIEVGCKSDYSDKG